MSASQVHCFVLDGQVSIVSDLNGNVTNVVCPMFDRVDYTCQIKMGA